MPPTRLLKVFIHFDELDRETVLDLSARLKRDGVDVLIRPSGAEDLSSMIQESHVVLLCVSKQFNKVELETNHTQVVLDLITQRKAINTRLLPIRLENCNIPARLQRWQAVDLFDANGYARLMIALQLRAEQVGVVLPAREGWRIPFVVKIKEINEALPAEDELLIDAPKRRSRWRIAFWLLIVAVLFMFLRNTVLAPSEETPIPVNILAANATQNSVEYAANRSSTLTAVAFAYSGPLTATAEYLTGAPLTTTAEYVISLYTPTPTRTPTPTLSPTITLTPRTIVVLPTEIMDANGAPMVLVPAGGFQMGDDHSTENARPAYNIYLLDFYIDKFEVTNVMYKPCVDAGACLLLHSLASETHSNYFGNPEYANFPVVNVDWNMANQFCKWRGARLPTEAEWEKAARGIDARPYPWGQETGCSFANYRDGSALCVGDTLQVGQYQNGKSIYGAYDMAGNVLEWVSSLYMPYPFNALDGREDPNAAGDHVLRGGSWSFTQDGISSFYRLNMDRAQFSLAGNDVGFRCAHDANP
jgi:formylglycine-generating enzyme required for sulfatase activity